jgi:hypothetical protein
VQFPNQQNTDGSRPASHVIQPTNLEIEGCTERYPSCCPPRGAKAAPESDTAALAASALQGNAGMERTQSNNTSSDDSEERLNEAFAKMKVTLQNHDSSSESTGMTVAEGQGKKTASQQFMDFMHLSLREKIGPACWRKWE